VASIAMVVLFTVQLIDLGTLLPLCGGLVVNAMPLLAHVLFRSPISMKATVALRTIQSICCCCAR
jgi:hypothetical protein